MKGAQAECVWYIKHGGVRAFAISIFTFMFILPPCSNSTAYTAKLCGGSKLPVATRMMETPLNMAVLAVESVLY